MILRAAKPSDLTPEEVEAFIAFVGNAGEVNLDTLPALTVRAAILVTLYERRNLAGTAAIKTPYDGHRRDEFRKAKAGERADAHPLELGWVVVHPNYRRHGNGRVLVAAAIEAMTGQGLYATTKTDSMRRMLPEYGFFVQGEPYRSELNPEVALTLFCRPALDSGQQL